MYSTEECVVHSTVLVESVVCNTVLEECAVKSTVLEELWSPCSIRGVLGVQQSIRIVWCAIQY